MGAILEVIAFDVGQLYLIIVRRMALTRTNPLSSSAAFHSPPVVRMSSSVPHTHEHAQVPRFRSKNQHQLEAKLMGKKISYLRRVIAATSNGRTDLKP